jgi:hypothetical protein
MSTVCVVLSVLHFLSYFIGHLMVGEGAFFKAHKDTPRAENMFGSLVVVFPTAHKGGTLVLRHRGQEWTFDSAKEVSQQARGSLPIERAALEAMDHTDLQKLCKVRLRSAGSVSSTDHSSLG